MLRVRLVVRSIAAWSIGGGSVSVIVLGMLSVEMQAHPRGADALPAADNGTLPADPEVRLQAVPAVRARAHCSPPRSASMSPRGFSEPLVV